jgi:DNA polymerase elongation subunit (family B)
MPIQIKSEKTLFHKTLIIDIETVPLVDEWNMLSNSLQKHWQHKMQFLHLNEEEMQQPANVFNTRAGIYAEFGKIVCIGLGYIAQQNDLDIVRLKSIQNDDEKALLEEFCELLTQFEKQHKDFQFCGHNIKEFDIPYICRRLIVNGIKLPSSLDIAGMKPWQINHLDTLELWRFGDYKSYISLDLLATILQVPTSKSDIDGSQVAEVYWKEKDLPRIASYCLKDVYTTTLVFLKLKDWTKALPEAHYV